MKKLLWIGDAGAKTGFERATRHTLDVVRRDYDVSVLGLNYFGDPHDYPYPVYPCISGGDGFGQGRLRRGFVPNVVEPDVIVIQNDPWNFADYLRWLPKGIPVIGSVAVDAKCCRGRALNDLAHCVFWTDFAEREARRGGYTGTASVIPLGVDLSVYRPQDRDEVRKRKRLDVALAKRGLTADAFIVNFTGRNQPRKRLDLLLEYFAEWVHSYNVRNVGLWLHIAPTGEEAYDIELLADYYGIADLVMVPQIPFASGVSEDVLSDCYAMSDLFMTTTQGEGFWLPGFEAAACGLPILAPDWSAIGDLFRDAAALVQCTSTAATPPAGISTIGGVADKCEMIEWLDRLYRSKDARRDLSQAGLTLVKQERFRWSSVGERFLDVVNEVIDRPAPCEHEWDNVTTHRSTERIFRCGKCHAERTEAFDAAQV